MKQQDFEPIYLKMSNKFPKKCKATNVRDAETLWKTIAGNVVENLVVEHSAKKRVKS